LPVILLTKAIKTQAGIALDQPDHNSSREPLCQS
jgi:hypothetical protein